MQTRIARACEQRNLLVDLWDPHMTPHPGHHPENPRQLGNLQFGAYATATVGNFPLATRSFMEATLSFTRENSNTVALTRGACKYPRTHLALITWDKSGKGQSLPWALVPAPENVLRWAKQSSWYQSTFHTSSGSFSAKEVTAGVSAPRFLPFTATWLATHLTMMPFPCRRWI